MFSPMRIKDLVCCPRCKGALTFDNLTEYELGVINGQLSCPSCKQCYPIRDGILIMLASEINTASKDWNLASFNALYKEMENEQSSREWLAKLRVPREIADYEYQKVKGRMMDWLQVPDNGTVLDVGAGSGYFVFEIMARLGKAGVSFVGIDPSIEHIKWLEHRKKNEKQNNILAVLGDARALPFWPHTFDVIICSEVLEHIPSKRAAIGEMARVLKPQGTLLLSTPSKSALDFWDLMSAPFRWILLFTARGRELAYDRPVYPNDLQRYLKEAGFSIENFELNVIMPPLSYFAHLPKFLGRPMPIISGFLENHMKTLLARRLALCIVLLARKTHESRL